MERITSTQAVLKGMKTLTYPVILISMGGFSLAIFLGVFFKSAVIGITSVIISFIPPFIWWEISLIRWKIWAFSEVKNVHELKRKAVKKSLMGEDEKLMKESRWMTSQQKEKLASLEQRFLEEDIPEKIENLPAETIIRPLWAIWIAPILLVLLMLCFLGYAFFGKDEHSLTVGLAVVVSCLFAMLIVVKSFKPSTITINSKGIDSEELGFVSWAEVIDFQIKEQNIDRGMRYFLVLETKNKPTQKIDIGDKDISVLEIEDLIKAYRSKRQI